MRENRTSRLSERTEEGRQPDLLRILQEQDYDHRSAPWDRSESISTDRRTTEYFTQTRALVGKVEEANVADICDQLAKDGLIDWYRSSSGPDEGSGRITERGVHLIQGIAIAASSKPEYIGKLIAAVHRSSASEAEKKEAKSLLENLAKNRLVMAALGTVLGGGSRTVRPAPCATAPSLVRAIMLSDASELR